MSTHSAVPQRRPKFHFTPAFGWINDPNGLIYYEGEYHLFYQYHPFDLLWGPMHWGHAVSTDLVHWTHLPIALAPDQNGKIFSGSVVADVDNTSGLVRGGGLVAIFSFDTQAQGIAYSEDCGRTWVKHAGNPVIPSPGSDFRDPKVFWYAQGNVWVMALAAGDHVEFLTSPNLINWTLTGRFGTDHGAHGGVWECPDLFPLQLDGATKWVLIVSVGDGAIAGGSGTQYFIGQFDGANFHNDNPADMTLWLDYGTDNYAGVTYNGIQDDRRLLIGWMNNWAYARKIPAQAWRGSMTVPRTLALVNVPSVGIRLTQQPVRELELYRTQVIDLHACVADQASLQFDEIASTALDIEVEFCPSDANSFGVMINAADDEISVQVDRAAETLSVNRQFSGQVDFHEGFAAVLSAPLFISRQTVRLRILIDMASIEVFSEDGLNVITTQVFPRASQIHLRLFSSTGVVSLNYMRVCDVN
jgi:fructan beta-fructosidase